MKQQLFRYATLITSLILSVNLFAQDTWTLSAGDGFGHYNNSTVFGMNVFNGQLYAATGSDSGFVYRSNTGNINDWTQVFSAPGPGSVSIDAINSTPVGGGNLYISSNGSWFDTSCVYRTTDGINWSLYFNSSSFVSHIIPFKGLGTTDSIYLIEKNVNGDRILKSHYNSSDPLNLTAVWDTVLNFEQLSPNSAITSFGFHNNKLFIGTSAAQLWSTTNGTDWVLNVNVGSGFGNPNNIKISAITSFLGYLFVGTENSAEGAQLWKSNDETTWTTVQQYPVGNTMIPSLTVADSKLWITATGPSDGVVTKSSDGITFIISNNNSFGNTGNTGFNSSIIQFGNNIYWAGEHFFSGGKVLGMNGAQIWRLCTVTPPTVNIGPDQTVCPGVMVPVDAGPGAYAYLWSNEATTQTTNLTAPANCTVEYIGLNGCSAYDTILINPLPAPTVNITSPFTTPYTVCSGISTNMTAIANSGVYTPDPPINKVTNDSISDLLAPVYDTINVSGLSTLCACDALMSVTIDSLYHTYCGDLEIKIFAPDGSNVFLSQQRGGSSDNSFMGTEFRMNALNWISSATPPFTGVYLPEGNFNSLTGNPNGAWVISIQDFYGGDDGNLKGWTIRFKTDDTVMTYSWSPASGLSSVNTLNTIATPTVSTTYTLITTNTIGCSTESTLSYDVPALSFQQSADTVCYGGSLFLTVQSGTALTTWSPATGLSGTTGDGVTASPSVSTMYYVIDTISSCPVSDSIFVYTNPQLFISDPAPVTICFGDTASLTASASGGSAPYSYTWDIGGVYFYGETILQSPAGGTSYTISVTDLAGCFAGGGSTNITVTPSTDIFGNVSYTGGNVTSSSVVLYKYFPFLTQFDTVQVDTSDVSGNYHFTSVNYGDYLIKVFPNATYTAIVPTYYGNTFLWDAATVLIHDCAMNDTLNIVAVEETLTPGPGSLLGTVLEGDGFNRIPGDPVPGIDVKLGRNPGGQLVTSTQTDSNGDYAFNGVGYDSYTIYVDIPGLGIDSSYTVVVDSANSNFTDLDYYVDSTTVYIVDNTTTGIVSTVSKSKTGLNVYPNPSKGNAVIEYVLDDESQISLGIYNVLGVKIAEFLNTKQFAGTYKFNISDKEYDLHSGVYFVTMILDGKTYIHRLVITK